MVQLGIVFMALFGALQLDSQARRSHTIHGLDSHTREIDVTAEYFYFKPGGKWKYDGKGASIPIDGHSLTHNCIRELNGGKMPGITGDGKSYTIVIIDPESYPRMIPAQGVCHDTHRIL